jgi:Ni,Fe-hydrogenase I large subunit
VNPVSNRERDLSIHCRIANGRIVEVKLQGRTTLAIDKLVCGKTPQQAIQLFALTYALCGHAHQRAAVSAFEQAMHVQVPPVVEQLRAVAGNVEIVKEHALNLLLRLPSGEIAPALPQTLLLATQMFGKALDSAALYAFPCSALTLDADAYDRALSALTASLGSLLGDFFSMAEPSPGDINAWQRDGHCAAARYLQQYAQQDNAGFGKSNTLHLPLIAADELETVLSKPGADAFIAAPHWHGNPCETNAYTRQAGHPLIREAVAAHGNGLYARSLARLLEIRLLYDTLPQQLPFYNTRAGSDIAAGSGTALVQVEASRGRLLHRVEVRDGLIAAYRIIAPTQWNFHPQGLLSAALTGQDARDEERLQRRIEAWVATLDPCVAFNVALESCV